MHIGLGRSLLATWSGLRIINILVIYTMMMVLVVVVVAVVMVLNTWSWLRYLITWLPYLESV